MEKKVIAVVMGGGRGTRLHPLTKERCKPAVPLAGKYRLVDIPISNCLNSEINRIYLLTQFNTASLHRHIQDTYRFDPFGGGRVDILSAEQTLPTNSTYMPLSGNRTRSVGTLTTYFTRPGPVRNGTARVLPAIRAHPSTRNSTLYSTPR